MTKTYWCERAWLPEGIADNVLAEIDDFGYFSSVSIVDRPSAHAERLWGLVLPGMANAHSHAFHRALRGRTGGGRGTFWTWRAEMYELAAKLDPEGYYRLATAVYSEMVLAGITCVGEFHYLHHPPRGGVYADPNAMSLALVHAASAAGIRLTLLDTCYLSGGFDKPVEGVQARYADGDVHGWLDRVREFTVDDHMVRVGAALHSVRAVPAESIPVLHDWARHREAPLHVHLSEQRSENEACLAAHGCTPTQLLESYGALGSETTAVHATHLTAADIALLGSSGTGVCLCPSTEADLADGIGPATALAVAGSPLSLGSDGQSIIDPFAELQAIEATMRLTTETRGHFNAGELLTMATSAGHRALGWQDAGWIGEGARADLIAIDLDSVRLAGVPAKTAALSAQRDDVRDVIVNGHRVVRDGVHQKVRDVSGRLKEEITYLQ